MKKFSNILFSLLLVVCSLIFVACGDKELSQLDKKARIDLSGEYVNSNITEIQETFGTYSDPIPYLGKSYHLTYSDLYETSDGVEKEEINIYVSYIKNEWGERLIDKFAGISTQEVDNEKYYLKHVNNLYVKDGKLYVKGDIKANFKIQDSISEANCSYKYQLDFDGLYPEEPDTFFDYLNCFSLKNEMYPKMIANEFISLIEESDSVISIKKSSKDLTTKFKVQIEEQSEESKNQYKTYYNEISVSGIVEDNEIIGFKNVYDVTYDEYDDDNPSIIYAENLKIKSILEFVKFEGEIEFPNNFDNYMQIDSFDDIQEDALGDYLEELDY